MSFSWHMEADPTHGCDLSQLAAAAASCVEHTAAGAPLLQCVQAQAPGPNWFLPRPMFDETLRNASCRAVSGSIPRRTIRAGDLANDGSCQSQLNVEVFRDTPPIVLVKGFATVEDCEKLLNQVDGLPSAPAKASGAAEGFIRRSSSKNLDWEMLHPTDDLRVFKSRMFALTRNLTGYPIPSEASEALNIAAYGIGDEYRAHCDGRCGGSALDRHGERVATSIVYCEVAALGGHTTFTSQHLKVVPQQGDMLVFGYLEDGRLSREVEHSACPVVAGRKWIATQWYRSAGSAGSADTG